MKIRCEVCGIDGQLQHLSRNYYRIKHYLGSVDGKARFEYHKQSLEYVQSNLSQKIEGIDPIGQENIDPNLLNNGFIYEKQRAGSSVWYECLTCTQEVGGSNPPQSTTTSITTVTFCLGMSSISAALLF